MTTVQNDSWLSRISAVMDKQACTELFDLLNRQHTVQGYMLLQPLCARPAIYPQVLLQVALVNEANTFAKRAWRSESAADLMQQLDIKVDAAWAAACTCNLYYRQADLAEALKNNELVA